MADNKILPLVHKDLVYKRRGDVVRRGWYYFDETTKAQLADVTYLGLKVVKGDGTYHRFKIESLDKKYVDEKCIWRRNSNDRVSLIDLNINPSKKHARKEKLDSLKKLISEKNKQIKSLTTQRDYYKSYMDNLIENNFDEVNKSALVVVTGWLGDAFFASSIAEQLKLQLEYARVDYLIGFPQTKLMLQNNIFIDTVYVYPTQTPYPNPETLLHYSKYHDVFVLPVNDLSELPTIKYQKHCGIKYPVPQFNCSIPHYFISSLPKDKTIIGVSSTWKDYNENYRDVDYIIDELSSKHPDLVFIKLGNNVSQFEGASQDNVLKFYSMLADMKSCEYVIGCEGGMLNFASSLGVKTICATDFTNALFGMNGKMYQYADWEKRITPRAFFPNKGHINLKPDFTTNDEIIQEISKILSKQLG